MAGRGCPLPVVTQTVPSLIVSFQLTFSFPISLNFSFSSLAERWEC